MYKNSEELYLYGIALLVVQRGVKFVSKMLKRTVAGLLAAGLLVSSVLETNNQKD